MSGFHDLVRWPTLKRRCAEHAPQPSAAHNRSTAFT